MFDNTLHIPLRFYDAVEKQNRLKASNVTTLYETEVDYDCQVIADDTNEALVVQVKNATPDQDGYVIRWVATIKTTEVSYVPEL